VYFFNVRYHYRTNALICQHKPKELPIYEKRYEFQFAAMHLAAECYVYQQMFLKDARYLLTILIKTPLVINLFL